MDRDDTVGTALRELPVPEHLPGFDERLRHRLSTPHRRLSLRRLALAGGVAAAAAAVLALAIGLPGDSNVASAAQVRDAVARGLSSTAALSGIAVDREAGGESRWRFLLVPDGSFRITSLDNGSVLAYDADANVETYSDGPVFVRRVGIAPGWPDSDAAPWVVQRGLGSVVATLADDATVREIDYAGRPAWLLTTVTGNAGETRDITVDRETGIPVRDERFRNSRPAGEWRIDKLAATAFDPGYSGDNFQLRRRPGQDPATTYDMGFRRTTLKQVGDALVPAWVPPGFRLAEVATAKRSRPTGSEQRPNPESRDVVSLAYRRGLQELTVTTRLIGADRTRWSDPVTAGILSEAPTPITFRFGALKDVAGELVIDPNAPPHVWALTDRLVVTVSGDVTRRELVRVANSLS